MNLTSELIQKYFNVKLEDIRLSSSSMEIKIKLPLAYWSSNDDTGHLIIYLTKRLKTFADKFNNLLK